MLTHLILGAGLMFGARTAASELDIRAFGVACDAVNDDAAKVQAALDRLAPGDTLLVSCRAAIGAAGLTLRDRQDITVRGVDGGGFVALTPTSLASQGFSPIMILLQNCTRCAVESLSIDMKGVGQAAIGIDRCASPSLRNNVIANVGFPANAGIVATGNRLASYTGNRVANTGKTEHDGTRGMWIGNGSETQEEWRPEVSGNVVTNAGATGIVVYAQGAAITGNTVTYCMGAGLKLIARSMAGASPGPQTRVSRNTLSRNWFHGLQVERAEGGVLVERNTMQSNVMAGLYAYGGLFSGTITNNTFSGNREAGIYLYTASGLRIQENRFEAGAPSPQGRGIVLEAMPGNAIQDVEISNNVIWDQAWNGITVRGRGGFMAGLRFESNSIGGRMQEGVQIEDASGKNDGSILLANNCFDRQLARTVVDQRSAAKPPPAGTDCTSPANTVRNDGGWK